MDISIFTKVPAYLCCNQELTKGCQPISSTSRKIIPARDTVAGDATARSSTCTLFRPSVI